MQLYFEQFPALNAIGICRHVFVQRIPGVDVSHDKRRVLKCLDVAHREIRNLIGIADWSLFTAQQVHGNKIAVVGQVESSGHADQMPRRGVPGKQFVGCDGMITNQKRVALGIYVADCCAVYLVDPRTPAIGLVHSGRKGTELRIVANAVKQMINHFGCNPANMVVQLSPCIRAPHYEVDFAGEIIRQCQAVGIEQIHDSGLCTACDLDHYYSYRAEKGKTGRMLAVLGFDVPI